MSSRQLAAGPGYYVVKFNRDIRSCAWTGTVGRAGFLGSSAAGYLTITGRVGTRNGLFITTYNPDGVRANRPFHVLVTCR